MRSSLFDPLIELHREAKDPAILAVLRWRGVPGKHHLLVGGEATASRHRPL